MMQQIFDTTITLRRSYPNHYGFFKNKTFYDIMKIDDRNKETLAYYNSLYDRHRSIVYYILCILDRDCGEKSVSYNDHIKERFLYRSIRAYNEFYDDVNGAT
jgi:hypothetical protein